MTIRPFVTKAPPGALDFDVEGYKRQQQDAFLLARMHVAAHWGDFPILRELMHRSRTGNSQKAEWLEDSPAGKRAAYNYMQIQRNPFPVNASDGEIVEKFHDHLLSIENTIKHGQRKLDTTGSVCVGYCGGLTDLGISMDKARLKFLRPPTLYVSADGERCEWLSEFTLTATWNPEQVLEAVAA